MGDLISREALRGKVRALKRETEPFRNCSYKTGYISALSTIECLLAHMAAVNAVEVARHERWAHLGGDEWCCTGCGKAIHTEGSCEQPTKKFCHECGAKMDKEGEK